MEQIIGNTPLIPLPAFGGIFAKVECGNLTGSAKDRAALFMINEAEKQGLLSPGGTIIEPTSGNTGIALAAIAAIRGYRAIIVMPDSMSPERIALMQAYGAQVVLTPGPAGMAAAIEKAQALSRQIPGSFLPAQFENPANALAHYCTTGPEIWAQRKGRIDIFVCTVGTGGTITGTGRYLKEQNPHIRILAVEPADSPVLSGGKAGPHGIQGIGAGFVPKVLDTSLLDGVIPVTQAAAFASAKKLAHSCGLLAGISSGAALHAAQEVACRNPGKQIVTLLPDTGMRYLSCGLFD